MLQAAADVWRWLRYLVSRPLVPLSPVTTVPSSRHWRHHATGSRVTPPQHVHTQHTFMQLLTAANHSILQGFKNVVALQYTQQPAVSSMATITYTADQSAPGGYPGIWKLLRCTKNCFLSAQLVSRPGVCSVCSSGGDAPCGDVSTQTGRGASGFKYLQKCLQVSTY